MKKTLSLILAALLLASSFISCSEKQNDGGETGSAADTADTSADETAPEEVKTDSNVRLWEGKTFNGYGVNILGRQSTMTPACTTLLALPLKLGKRTS